MYNNRPCYPVVIPSVYNDQHQELPMTPPHVTSLLLPMSLSPPSPTPSMSSTSSSSSDEQPPSPDKTDDTSPEKVARTRISFTTSQQSDLESEFQKSAYLHKTRRVEIAKRLELEEKHIKVWFQNRRMKSKRENAAKSSLKPQSENKTTQNTASPKPVRKDTLLQKVLRKNAAATQVAAKKSQGITNNGSSTVGNLYNNLSHIPLSVNQGKAHNPSEQQYRLVLLPQQPYQRLQQFPFQYVVPQQWSQNQQFYPPSALTQQQEVMLGAPHYLSFQQTKNPTSESIPRSIGNNMQAFDDIKSFQLSDREDNINLDDYFHNTSSSTPSLDVSIGEDETQNPSKRMKIDEDDFDFNKILANLVDAPAILNNPVNSNPPDSIERDDFDVDDFINNLDKYVSYPEPRS